MPWSIEVPTISHNASRSPLSLEVVNCDVATVTCSVRVGASTNGSATSQCAAAGTKCCCAHPAAPFSRGPFTRGSTDQRPLQMAAEQLEATRSPADDRRHGLRGQSRGSTGRKASRPVGLLAGRMPDGA
eukprot:278657-Prymnesium_polylepis.1